jgi:hypothetical protein
MLTEKIKLGIGGVPLSFTKPKRFPSLFARKDTELPAWLAFDKQMEQSKFWNQQLITVEFLKEH